MVSFLLYLQETNLKNLLEIVKDWENLYKVVYARLILLRGKFVNFVSSILEQESSTTL